MGHGRATLLVPSISLVELRYLEEKGRPDVPAGTTDRVASFLTTAHVSLAPLDLDVALAVDRVPRSHVPDMPDRIVAATALARGAHLMTKDETIRRWAGVAIVW